MARETLGAPDKEHVIKVWSLALEERGAKELGKFVLKLSRELSRLMSLINKNLSRRIAIEERENLEQDLSIFLFVYLSV